MTRAGTLLLGTYHPTFGGLVLRIAHAEARNSTAWSLPQGANSDPVVLNTKSVRSSEVVARRFVQFDGGRLFLATQRAGLLMTSIDDGRSWEFVERVGHVDGPISMSAIGNSVLLVGTGKGLLENDLSSENAIIYRGDFAVLFLRTFWTLGFEYSTNSSFRAASHDRS